MQVVNMPGFSADSSLHRMSDHHFRQFLRSATDRGESGVVYPARICSRGVCACSGDADCNGMFSNACSRGGYARCWIRGPGDGNVFCVCT